MRPSPFTRATFSSSLFKHICAVMVFVSQLQPAYSCVVTYTVPAVDEPCLCASNACAYRGRRTESHVTVRGAIQGEQGYDTVAGSIRSVGTTNNCTMRIDWKALLGCTALVTTCTLTCAGVATGVGVAVCIGCLSSSGFACGVDCLIQTCVEDPSGATDVMAYVVDSVGGTCTGTGS